MEHSHNHLNTLKNSAAPGAIGLSGAFWISHLGTPFPNVIFNTVIWLVLIYSAWIDWKTQHIHDAVPLCVGVLGAVYCMITYKPLEYWGFGVLLNGILMGILYTASRKSIGLGDVKLLIALGVSLGPWMSFNLLFHASWMGALVALAGIARKKLKLGQVIPFCPFIAAGYLMAISLL